MSVLKAVFSFYRTGEERPIERYKARLKVQEEHRTLSTLKKKTLLTFLVSTSKRRSSVLGHLTLNYRLAKISGKIENYSLSIQLYRLRDSESELNSKYS